MAKVLFDIKDVPNYKQTFATEKKVSVQSFVIEVEANMLRVSDLRTK